MLSFSNFILLPLAAAIIVSFFNRKPRLATGLTLFTFSIGLVYVLLAFLKNKAGAATMEVFSGEDIFTIMMLGLIYLVGLCVCWFAAYAEKTERKGTYYALILTATAGMCGITAARDFFTVYVFLEVIAVCAFTLIAFYNREKGTEGALKYFYLSSLASTAIMFAIAILFLYAGGTSFEHLKSVMASNQANPVVINVFLGIMACGFMVKTGLVPFHTWTPDAYESASTPVSALLAGIITKAAGAYTLIKIAMMLGITNHLTAHNPVGKAIMVFGAVSIVAGSVMALYQTSFKRMLAYSSISQMGYIFLAAGLSTPLGLAGAIFHLFNHATFKTALFFNAGALESAAGTSNIKELSGLEKQMPYTSMMSLISMLSTAGIPPLSGFWSKFIIILALWQSGFYLFAFIALFASVITLAYFLRAQRNIFFGRAEGKMKEVKEVRAGMLIPAGIFVFIMIAVGLYFPLMYTSFIEPFIKGGR
ncbi:Putative Ech hydrogenase component [Elusimicrobium minutum Pei191]|uniref:Putative Ech hydrogenase component n=1 Tax=Elusimicrobium minutum (strain Pei191) TaxID=445932 RepID=B2KDU2_ELUMP|nr:proton-conducting transporter membrane subunit [Elusimicrobium minutum]ACC98688.1 Putative Ech hydrogenase component [Elusimicrobium minutum Pei191]